MPIEIDKINFKIGDQEIPLTLDQAKELQQFLNHTFGLDRVYRPGQPIYFTYPPHKWRVPPYRHWEILCGADADGSDGTVTCSLN